MNRVLVIVVTYNGMKWLDRCLGSVEGADIFVVDNDSTDGSADSCRYVVELVGRIVLVEYFLFFLSRGGFTR